MFRLKLHEADWGEIETSRNPNVCYEIFSKMLMSLSDECFSIKVIKLKTKGIKTPWITAGKKKSSNHKQPLYEKFLKSRYKKAENAKHSIIQIRLFLISHLMSLKNQYWALYPFFFI